MEGSGGGSGSDHHGATAASLMSFRDNNMSTGGGGSSNGLSSMLMVMAPPPHHHHPQPNSSEMVNNNNTLFLPLSSNNNNHNFGSSHHHHQMYGDHGNGNDKHAAAGYYFMMKHNNIDKQHDNNSSSSSSFKRAKIMAHPHYFRLLTAYINCQKIGAPAEVVTKLEEIFASEESRMSSSSSSSGVGSLGEDPGLDQFMEAYCEMLSKYEQELTKPFKEAMIFISNIEAQLKTLTISTSSDHHSGRNNKSSEEDFDASDNFIDPQADDKELKIQLLRKYSGYLGSLKQEFLKKRKKGKLPKDARQQLMDWWTRYYKWPYPSETQKLALAESTGLDQKQINNWFINQRKRHWKPSEDMQFVVMDAAHMHPNHQYYIDNLLTPNPFSIDYSCAPSSLM